MLIIPMAHDPLLMAVSKNNIKSFRCAKKKKNPNERLRESIKEMKDYILLKLAVEIIIWLWIFSFGGVEGKTCRA